mmetsp:Transcript_2035/g.3662  ORF Transcript_2035/g.3662 Transcript_2035/m.3662 type:complete len:291 (+) Transcript_2035:449-1321(+)
MDPFLNTSINNTRVDDDDPFDILQLVLEDHDACSWLLSQELVGQSCPSPSSNEVVVPDMMMNNLNLNLNTNANSNSIANTDVYSFRCPPSTPVCPANMNREASEYEDVVPDFLSTSACASGSQCGSPSSEGPSAGRDCTLMVKPNPAQTLILNQMQTQSQTPNQPVRRPLQGGKQAQRQVGIRAQVQPHQPHQPIQPVDPLSIAAASTYYAEITKIFNTPCAGTSPTISNTSICCELCHRIYRRKFDLCRHVRESHLMQRDYECGMCLRKFKRVEHRNKHLALKHKVVVE